LTFECTKSRYTNWPGWISSSTLREGFPRATPLRVRVVGEVAADTAVARSVWRVDCRVAGPCRPPLHDLVEVGRRIAESTATFPDGGSGTFSRGARGKTGIPARAYPIAHRRRLLMTAPPADRCGCRLKQPTSLRHPSSDRGLVVVQRGRTSVLRRGIASEPGWPWWCAGRQPLLKVLP
jgi:hypothetical protein